MDKEFSNELQVKKDTAAFIVLADDDTGVPAENSIVFYEALRKNKIPAEMHIYVREAMVSVWGSTNWNLNSGPKPAISG